MASGGISFRSAISLRRTLYGQGGTQQMHGAPVQGSSPAPKDFLSQFGPEVTDKNTLVRK